MLNRAKAFSSFSVNDLNAAKTFYRDVLGLEVNDEEEGFLQVKVAGDVTVLAYEKGDHTPATYTVLNFNVSSVEQAVTDLIARGVRFEQYHSEYIQTDERGISTYNGEGPTMAWFTDPAGNIMALMQDA